MAETGDYTVNPIYGGRYSSLNPETYSPHGIYAATNFSGKKFGSSTIPIVNQLAQVNTVLSQGVIPIEAGVMDPKMFEQIPKQHFKEMSRAVKLAGSDMTWHAPLVEASGISSQHQQPWTESARLQAEKQLKAVVDRTAPLNETGGMSITFHGSVQVPGTEYIKTKEGVKTERVVVINQETGKMIPLEEEQKRYPGYVGEKLEKGKILLPEKQIDDLNNTEWSNSISQLMHHKEDADLRIRENMGILPKEMFIDLLQHPEKRRLLDPVHRNAWDRIVAARQFLQDAQQGLNGMFNKAWKFGTEADKKLLEKASANFRKDLEQGFPILRESEAIQNLAETLSGISPQIYKPVNEFALDKSADTFSNVALHGFKEFKDKAPVVNIENVFPGMAFTYSDEWKKLIEQSRNKFVQKAVEQGMLSESEAKAKAEKLIGATLDVGHLNTLKKKGFIDEDLIKEVEQIAPYVKHIHITDNFGSEDTHLPPGMGNVPIKEIMEKLKSEGVEPENINKVLEAGGFIESFRESPIPYALEALGGQVYEGGPYWSQASALSQSYSGGFGNMLPQIHYETFGAKFTNLPAELGGNIPGRQGSRLSGTPTE